MVLIPISILIGLSFIFRALVFAILGEAQTIPFSSRKRSKNNILIDFIWFIIYPAILIYQLIEEPVFDLFLFKCLISGIFFALLISDGLEFRLPNELCFLCILTVLVFICFEDKDLLDAGLGFALGFTVGLAIESLSKLYYKRPVFGIGDVKLLAVIGLLVGWQDLLYVFTAGMTLATVYSLTGIALKRLTWKSKIPVGSFLCMVTIIYFVLNI